MSPIDPSRYPPDWPAISRRIRERAGQRCQFCGARNGELVRRGARRVRIVLTVAHLDHDTRNNADENLRALCQRCHLRHDAEQHAENAARTRARKRRESQSGLFEAEP